MDASFDNLYERAVNPPLLTADLPGVGGVSKAAPEDFVVEEIPAYEPAGEGEHLFLWVEKRDVSADQLVRHLAERLGVHRNDVGTAGMKDRRAVTRQYVSVPASCGERLSEAESDAVHVLEARRNPKKLRTGHLRGNRFTITLRDVECDDALDRARAIRDRLVALGVPNCFGTQRFGSGGSTLKTGLELLSGEKRKRDLKGNRRFLLRLSLSAVQSALFNAYLAERLEAGRLHRVCEGDVMQVIASGGPFLAEDVDREQPRFDARAIVPTGPMFGPKMRRPGGEPQEWEERLLAESGLSLDDFGRFGKLAAGTRRPLLVFPEGIDVGEPEAGVLRFTFDLPSGSYATVVLREFAKDAPVAS